MRIGIDLGGTKIEAVALGENGAELFRRRVDTPRGSYDGTVSAIKALVDAAERSVGARGTVGVGIPGTISPASGLVKNANSTWLNGRPFDRDLAAALSRPVRLANDANCFALSEATDGAAAGAAVVFGVIIGTGTGGGVVVQRRVLVGPNAVAGEWGHNPLPWPSADEVPGEPCYCGLSGCIETFLSGSGLQRTDAEIRGIDRGHAAAEIARLAGDGDLAASAALERYCDRMARALASIINVLDPDVIVLGGGLSNIDRLYEHVPRLWQKLVFSDAVATPLVKARHGDSSGVRGAAWLWNE
jgi:fructokinase